MLLILIPQQHDLYQLQARWHACSVLTPVSVSPVTMVCIGFFAVVCGSSLDLKMCVCAEMAAAEMQLLRQALDKLQSETQVLDDELARSREQAIFSELERAELSNDLEVVTAQLRSCEASKAELEGTIAKVTPATSLPSPSLRLLPCYPFLVPLSPFPCPPPPLPCPQAPPFHPTLIPQPPSSHLA